LRGVGARPIMALAIAAGPIVRKSSKLAGAAGYGRGTGVPDPVDVQVGARIRTRRLLIGMNQETLASRLGLTFQQVQKYEGGANRVSASRLSQIAEILGVTIDFFFNELAGDDGPGGQPQPAREQLQRPEAIDLIRAYYSIADPRVRQQFLDMIKAVAQSQRP
jgi:transcriptional regulator with XRE-family HTH domain